MRASALKYTILSASSSISLFIILLMPFHAFLTVWLSSIVGHYTALRLWKEALLVLITLGAIFLLITDQKIRSHTLTRLLVWLILAYGAVNVIWGLIGLHEHSVTAKAMGYGLIVNLRFVAFFLVTWSCAIRMSRLRVHWQWVALWPAIIVVLLGLLQILFLPKDFLVHFGYGPDTIPASATINHNSHYLRYASTLRGPNPLGAYLLIPVSLLTMLIIRGKRTKIYSTILAATFIVLLFTFSRSAWIGALISLAVILFLALKSQRAQTYVLIAAACLVVAVGSLFVVFRHNTRFENFVFHTQTHSAVKTTSDHEHLKALKTGVVDVLKHPLGRGPGSAGPASVYNKGNARIAENYYIQVGQEIGWLGLSIFLLISIGAGYLLWLRRGHPLALSLFASLIGISFICLLSHAWTDDTLAYVWWGLAGIAMAPGLNPEE